MDPDLTQDDTIIFSGSTIYGTTATTTGTSVAVPLPPGTVSGAVLASSGAWITLDAHSSIPSIPHSLYPIIVTAEVGANKLKITNTKTGQILTFDVEDCTIEIEHEARIKLTPEQNYELAMKVVG